MIELSWGAVTLYGIQVEVDNLLPSQCAAWTMEREFDDFTFWTQPERARVCRRITWRLRVSRDVYESFLRNLPGHQDALTEVEQEIVNTAATATVEDYVGVVEHAALPPPTVTPPPPMHTVPTDDPMGQSMRVMDRQQGFHSVEPYTHGDICEPCWLEHDDIVGVDAPFHRRQRHELS